MQPHLCQTALNSNIKIRGVSGRDCQKSSAQALIYICAVVYLNDTSDIRTIPTEELIK